MATVSSFKGLMLNRFDFERADVPEDMEGTNVGGAEVEEHLQCAFKYPHEFRTFLYETQENESGDLWSAAYQQVKLPL